MVEERQPTAGPSVADVLGLTTLVDGLRDDYREDLAALEGRLMAVIAEVRRDGAEFAVTHGHEHEAMAERSLTAHDRFDRFIDAAELDQAIRRGVLGAFKYGLEQVARYAKPIALILGALAGFLATVTGQLPHIEVSAR